MTGCGGAKVKDRVIEGREGNASNSDKGMEKTTEAVSQRFDSEWRKWGLKGILRIGDWYLKGHDV